MTIKQNNSDLIDGFQHGSRRNKGKTDGKYLGAVLDESWSIYETATGYRASSVALIRGKANYSFAIKDRQIDRHINKDASTMQEERPELYEAIEKFFGRPDGPITMVDEGDEYGDIAWTQRKTFTPSQQWKRMQLRMRMFELENAAKNEPSTWDMGIRMTFSGIFKFKISDDEYQRAHDYITNHGKVDLQALLIVLRDFFDGKYAPHSCATLDKQFDLIAGKE